jgi:hypothetical protein
METNPTIQMRLWRRVPWTSNPLMRASDRLEVMFAFAAVCFAVLALPLSVAAGTAAHQPMLERAARDLASKHTVTATLETDATPGYDRALTSSATARWTVGGERHTKSVSTRSDAKIGDHIDIWVDAAGDQVAPPMTRSDATKQAISVGVLAWFGVAGGSFAVVGAVHLLLDRRRLAGWDREWRELGAVER